MITEEIVPVLAGIAVIVGAVLTAVTYYQTRLGPRATAKKLILRYLEAHGYTVVSYDRIRRDISQDYTNEFLEKLPHYFPDELRRARVRDKNKGLTIAGLARIGREPEAIISDEPAGI